MKKTILFSITVILVSVTAILCVKKSNDHQEYSQIQELKTLDNKTLDNKTTVVTTNIYACKEKFNF